MEPQPLDQLVEVHDHCGAANRGPRAPLLENESRSREREAVQVKSEKSEAQDTGDSDSNVHATKRRKTTRGLLEELVLLTRSDARAEQSPRSTKGAGSTEIKALKEAHTTEVRALKEEHQTALKERRKHQDKQQEVVGPLKEALEKAKKKAESPRWRSRTSRCKSTKRSLSGCSLKAG